MPYNDKPSIPGPEDNPDGPGDTAAEHFTPSHDPVAEQDGIADDYARRADDVEKPHRQERHKPDSDRRNTGDTPPSERPGKSDDSRRNIGESAVSGATEAEATQPDTSETGTGPDQDAAPPAAEPMKPVAVDSKAMWTEFDRAAAGSKPRPIVQNDPETKPWNEMPWGDFDIHNVPGQVEDKSGQVDEPKTTDTPEELDASPEDIINPSDLDEHLRDVQMKVWDILRERADSGQLIEPASATYAQNRHDNYLEANQIAGMVVNIRDQVAKNQPETSGDVNISDPAEIPDGTWEFAIADESLKINFQPLTGQEIASEEPSVCDIERPTRWPFDNGPVEIEMTVTTAQPIRIPSEPMHHVIMETKLTAQFGSNAGMVSGVEVNFYADDGTHHKAKISDQDGERYITFNGERQILDSFVPAYASLDTQGLLGTDGPDGSTGEPAFALDSAMANEIRASAKDRIGINSAFIQTSLVLSGMINGPDEARPFADGMPPVKSIYESQAAFDAGPGYARELAAQEAADHVRLEARGSVKHTLDGIISDGAELANPEDNIALTDALATMAEIAADNGDLPETLRYLKALENRCLNGRRVGQDVHLIRGYHAAAKLGDVNSAKMVEASLIQESLNIFSIRSNNLFWRTGGFKPEFYPRLSAVAAECDSAADAQKLADTYAGETDKHIIMFNYLAGRYHAGQVSYTDVQEKVRGMLFPRNATTDAAREVLMPQDVVEHVPGMIAQLPHGDKTRVQCVRIFINSALRTPVTTANYVGLIKASDLLAEDTAVIPDVKQQLSDELASLIVQYEDKLKDDGQYGAFMAEIGLPQKLRAMIVNTGPVGTSAESVINTADAAVEEMINNQPASPDFAARITQRRDDALKTAAASYLQKGRNAFYAAEARKVLDKITPGSAIREQAFVECWSQAGGNQDAIDILAPTQEQIKSGDPVATLYSQTIRYIRTTDKELLQGGITAVAKMLTQPGGMTSSARGMPGNHPAGPTPDNDSYARVMEILLDRLISTGSETVHSAMAGTLKYLAKAPFPHGTLKYQGHFYRMLQAERNVQPRDLAAIKHAITAGSDMPMRQAAELARFARGPNRSATSRR